MFLALSMTSAYVLGSANSVFFNHNFVNPRMTQASETFHFLSLLAGN